jgi:hypothetical protein
MIPGTATSACAIRLLCGAAASGEGLSGERAIKSPFTRHFFLTSSQTPRDIHPSAKATAANSRGPTGPNLVVTNVIVGSGTKNKKADKIKNMTALMINEPGSIRVPPGISSQE